MIDGTPRPRRSADSAHRVRHRLAAPLGLALALVLGVGPMVVPGPIAAANCDASAERPWNSDPGALVLADNFESGSFGSWSQVVREGDAWAYVSASRRVSGWCSGALHVTSNSGSRAYVRKWIGWQARDVWVSGSFNIDTEGWLGNNVPLVRLWNDSGRIVDVYRQNGAGILWLRTANGSGGWWYVKLNKWIALDRWYSVKLHVRPSWSASTVEVWVDGSRLYSDSSHWMPAGNLTSVMIGAEHRRQKMDLYFDDVVIKAT
jgi:hypothetical protein